MKKATSEEPHQNNLVRVRDLSVDFAVAGNVNHAVRKVSFHIKKGETVALVGESGSGKTVSALSILRLLPYPAASHPSGEIYFHGRDLLKLDEGDMRQMRGARISIIFQEPMTSLNPLQTIDKQVGEVLRVHRGMDKAAERRRVRPQRLGGRLREGQAVPSALQNPGRRRGGEQV